MAERIFGDIQGITTRAPLEKLIICIQTYKQST